MIENHLSTNHASLTDTQTTPAGTPDKPGATPKPRLYALQGLRGIAAALVVGAHSIEHGPGTPDNAVVLTGRFGVDIFFVISGIVITYVAGNGRFDPRRFILRRIWRVTPLYWLLTLLVAGLALAAPQIFKTTKFGLHYLLTSLAFIPSPLPGTHDWRPLFKLGWTLNYEVFFYLVMTLLFWCTSMRQRTLALTVIMGLFFAGAFVVNPKTFLAFYANLNLLPFIIGVWLAYLWNEGVFERLPRFAPVALVIIAIGMTLYFYQTPFSETRDLGGHLAMTAAASCIAIATLSLERHIGAHGLAVWLGDISYSLYLTHMFVVGAAWAILTKLDLPSVAIAAGTFGMFAASLVVAHFSYKWIERPLMARQPFSRAL